MTIMTKPFTGVQAKKPDQVKDGEKLMKDVDVKIADVPEESIVDAGEFIHPSSPAARVVRSTYLCALISVLGVILLLGIGAGVHSYNVFVLRNSYAGMCKLPLRDLFSESTIIGASLKEREMSMEAYSSLLDSRSTQLVPEFKNTFELDFDIDVEEETYEMVELPEIFFGKYIHDFKYNLSVIMDVMRQRCYVMKLDRTVINPPKSMIDMIRKLRSGVYDIDFQEIRKNYRIFGEAVPNMDGLGDIIPRACSNKDTFWLEEMVGDVIVKRSTSMEKYGEFTGSAILQYHIVNLD